MSRLAARRLYAPVVLATLAAGGAAFFASSRTWTSATVEANGLPTDLIGISGTKAQPLLGALALVVVTAAIAVLAAGVRSRRWVGGLIVVASIGGVVLAIMADPSSGSAMGNAVTESPAFTGHNAPTSFDGTWWQLATIVVFAVAALLGGVTAVVGPRWPTMGSRYDAPTTKVPDAIEDEKDMWKALDAGQDPTL